MTQQQEQEIIAKVRQGDTRAYSILVDKYQNIVFSLALRILKNREEAEEMAQEAFIRAFRSLESFRGNSRFSTWLYTIAYNSCLSQVRKNKLSHSGNSGLDPGVEIWEEQENRENEEQRSCCLEAALKKLPEEDYLLVILHYYDNQRIDEISRITGLGESNVKVRLHRARKKLQAMMNEMLKETILN